VGDRRRSGTLIAILLAISACAAPIDQPTPGPTTVFPAPGTMPAATDIPSPSAAPVTPGPTSDATAEPTAGPTAAPTASAPPLDVWVGPDRVGTRRYDELSLVIDSDGIAHAAAELNDAIFYLTNASGSWTRERITTPLAGGSDREPSIAYDVLDDFVSIAFTRYSTYDCFELGCFPADSTGIFVLSKYGSEWSQPVGVAGTNAVRPVLRAGNGSIHIAYELVGRRNTWVHHATPADPGPSWNDTRLGVGSSPSLQVGSDGLPRIVFIDDDVFYAVAQSQTGPFDIEQVAGIQGWPELLLGRADQPHIVYTGWDEPWSILHTAWNGSSWTAPDLIAHDELADEASIDAADAIHVLFNAIDSGDEDDDGLWYTSNRGGSYQARQIDQSTRAAIDGPVAASALAIDRFNRPHILYVVPFGNRAGLYYAIGPGG
jgi:hypothetical protein